MLQDRQHVHVGRRGPEVAAQAPATCLLEDLPFPLAGPLLRDLPAFVPNLAERDALKSQVASFWPLQAYVRSGASRAMWLMILNSLCGVSTWMPYPWASQLSNDGGFTGATIESLVTERGSSAATIGVAKPYGLVACVADRVQWVLGANLLEAARLFSGRPWRPADSAAFPAEHVRSYQT